MDSRESVVVRNAKILGGTPVFRGRGVPLQLLFDSLEQEHTVEEFLAGYPTVSREMVIAALEEGAGVVVGAELKGKRDPSLPLRMTS